MRYEVTVYKNILGDREFSQREFDSLEEIVGHYGQSDYSALDYEIWDNEENRKINAWDTLVELKENT